MGSEDSKSPPSSLMGAHTLAIMKPAIPGKRMAAGAGEAAMTAGTMTWHPPSSHLGQINPALAGAAFMNPGRSRASVARAGASNMYPPMR